MSKKAVIGLALSAMALFLVNQAHALTLTNREAVDQRVQITEDGDEAITQDIILLADYTLYYLCEYGCTIALENGRQESFEGYEDISIEDGYFVIAE
jgi:hypothetical protein